LAKSGEGRSRSSIQPYVTRAMARIALQDDKEATLSALSDINTALVLWGPPGPQPAQPYFALLIWRGALYGMARSHGVPPENLSGNAFGTDTPPWALATESGASPECRGLIRRIAGPTIGYPAFAISMGRIGGAVIVTQLSPDGRVLQAQMGASIPEPSFGEEAIRAIRDWQFEVSPGTDAQCLSNYRIIVSFGLVY
jgi:TonB family protein